MASQALTQILDRLNGDWNFISNFLDDPETAIAGYRLEEEEKKAMLARDPQSLMALGIEQETAVAALSGAHSQTCPGPSPETLYV